MPEITPCLWFDQNAKEAVAFYTSLFPHSTTGKTVYYDEASAKVSGQPEGSVLTIEFSLSGKNFLALNGGPVFQFTPAISFSIIRKDVAELDRLWNALVQEGKVLMPYEKYPFSEKYGWLQDRFGVSWQLNVGEKEDIIPSFLFTQEHNGQALTAMQFYTQLFPKSTITTQVPYEPGQNPAEGAIMYGSLTLSGQPFIAMDGGTVHAFTFTHGISFIIDCQDQNEVDYYWEKLLQGGVAEPCGWLKDQFGVSWQVVPKQLNELLEGPNGKKVMQAMLEMSKLDVAELEKAARD